MLLELFCLQVDLLLELQLLGGQLAVRLLTLQRAHHLRVQLLEHRRLVSLFLLQLRLLSQAVLSQHVQVLLLVRCDLRVTLALRLGLVLC